MAVRPSKRTAYYRRVSFKGVDGTTLQQLLSQALASQATIKDRLQAVDAAASEFRFISDFVTDGNYLCGRLTAFQRGSFQLVIEDNEGAKSLSLAAIKPPKSKGGMQQQFVPGILHFVVFGNHIAIVQSTALRSSGFEEYLLWLLRDRTRLMNESQGLVLKDEPQKATKARIRKSHVTSVLIGKPLMDEIAPAKPSEGVVSAKFKTNKKTLQFLRSFIEDSEFERIGLKDEIFDGNLEVWIEIRYPKYQRRRPDSSVELLDNLAIALRDVDEGQTRLKLADGSVVLGKDLKISSSVDIYLDEGVPDESKLYRAMQSWIKELIKNDIVSPD